MPIRINLLAEAQALEDLRRRDPVKRALLIGGLLVCLVLLWSSSLQLKAMMAKADLAKIDAELSAKSNDTQVVVSNQRKLVEVSDKLGALTELATNRFLNGTALNALQQATVDDVQLTRFRAEQAYTLTEATKPRTNADRSVTPGKPATVNERILLILDARDGGLSPGDQIDKFRVALTNCSYFQAALGRTKQMRLNNISPPQIGPDGKPFVLFTFECLYSEKTR